MKYIRTKDGIYLNGGEFGYPRVGIIGKKQENDFGFCFDKTDVIKQANTIEELCDELVIHNPSNDGDFFPKYFVYKNKWETMLKPLSEYQKSKGIEIFGAIWTEWGLKYVAKMNETTGDIELL